MEKETNIINWEQVNLSTTVSAVKRVEFVSDRMSYVGSERLLAQYNCFECESTK